MNLVWKSGVVVLVAIGLVAVGAVGMNMLTGQADAQPGKKAPVAPAAPASTSASARYTVVETEGVHLIVTDNQTNILYFYTIDDGEKPGADLHLRGSADLNQVGKPVIKPTLINPKKRRG